MVQSIEPDNKYLPAKQAGTTSKDASESLTSVDTWQACQALLEQKLTHSDFNVWIRPLNCFIKGSNVYINAPNRYIVDRIKKDFLEYIRQALVQQLKQQDIQIEFCVSDNENFNYYIENTDQTDQHNDHTCPRNYEGSVVERAQLELFQLEKRGQFTAVSISSHNEFPTLLTRLPIFVPGRARKQQELLDKDNALAFQTSWGIGRKFGPPLTVYDEDTLIALSRLRQNILIGEPSKMPYPVSRLYAQSDETDIHVHIVLCMVSDIQSMCATSVGGKNNKIRLESIKRLAGTKIEFNREMGNKVKVSGTAIDLLNVKWDAYEDNALLYVQFSPIMAQWLERAYTYIDWHLRRTLRTDVGKAVHRFLSGQPKKYSIYTKKLKNTIGHLGQYKYFMTDLREALQQLQQLDWLKEYEIIGNGRKLPHKLVINRH